jgi:D-alanyl-D-alanine carboxypeptidase
MSERALPSYRRRRSVLLAMATMLSVAVSVPTAAADTAAGQNRALNVLVQQDTDAGGPGVIVRVDDGRGRVTEIARQAAWTRADNHLSADDQFRMGSNTKTMVATVLLQLVAERRLRLTDSVEKWLPGLVTNGRAITLRMLLNHTSGLADYVLDPVALAAITGQDQRTLAPEQLLAIAAQHPVLFPPGQEHSYSNTNYIALGLVLERVTGRSVADLIHDRIVRPLNLRHTYLAVDSVSRDGDKLAHGYEPDAAHLAPLLPPGVPPGVAFVGPARGDHVDATAISPAWAWAAGAIVSTPRDWAVFLSALMSGRLMPAAQLAEMRTFVDDPTSAGTVRYGLGLLQYTNSCGTVWGHTGGVPGYASQNYTDTTGRRSVSVVSTTQFGLLDPKLRAADQKVVDAAVCTMLGKPVAGN